MAYRFRHEGSGHRGGFRLQRLGVRIVLVRLCSCRVRLLPRRHLAQHRGLSASDRSDTGQQIVPYMLLKCLTHAIWGRMAICEAAISRCKASHITSNSILHRRACQGDDRSMSGSRGVWPSCDAWTTMPLKQTNPRHGVHSPMNGPLCGWSYGWMQYPLQPSQPGQQPMLKRGHRILLPCDRPRGAFCHDGRSMAYRNEGARSSHLCMHVGVGLLRQAVGGVHQLCLGLGVFMRLPVELLLLCSRLLGLAWLQRACSNHTEAESVSLEPQVPVGSGSQPCRVFSSNTGHAAAAQARQPADDGNMMMLRVLGHGRCRVIDPLVTGSHECKGTSCIGGEKCEVKGAATTSKHHPIRSQVAESVTSRGQDGGF